SVLLFFPRYPFPSVLYTLSLHDALPICYRLWFDTFFQTNPVQAEKLVELALDMAQPKKTEKMIDLFCGVGTFSLPFAERVGQLADRKSTRLNSSHVSISYAVFCLKKKKK